jgi:hypothetical protein
VSQAVYDGRAMLNPRAMNLWALCCLGLALVLLLPWEASAQRRRRAVADTEDPICYRSPYGVCQKWRVGLVGAGILSPEGASTAVGFKLGYGVVLGPRLELGGTALFVKDVRVDEGPYLGTVEGVLRIATIAGPNHRVLLELGMGGSRYESPEIAYWAFPSASAGATFELSGPGLGIFVTTGLSLMWAQGLAALPHAGVGLVF